MISEIIHQRSPRIAVRRVFETACCIGREPQVYRVIYRKTYVIPSRDVIHDDPTGLRHLHSYPLLPVSERSVRANIEEHPGAIGVVLANFRQPGDVHLNPESGAVVWPKLP